MPFSTPTVMRLSSHKTPYIGYKHRSSLAFRSFSSVLMSGRVEPPPGPRHPPLFQGHRFSVLTLPVEFNASKRAVALLSERGFLRADELVGARKVLSAAALTYVASTAMAAMQLLRMLFLRQSRD
jgi:hypothetical protein